MFSEKQNKIHHYIHYISYSNKIYEIKCKAPKFGPIQHDQIEHIYLGK